MATSTLTRLPSSYCLSSLSIVTQALMLHGEGGRGGLMNVINVRFHDGKTEFLTVHTISDDFYFKITAALSKFNHSELQVALLRGSSSTSSFSGVIPMNSIQSTPTGVLFGVRACIQWW